MQQQKCFMFVTVLQQIMTSNSILLNLRGDESGSSL